MKLFFYAIMSEALIPQGFLDIEKERKLQYQWHHNFRSNMVRVTGLWNRALRHRFPHVKPRPLRKALQIASRQLCEVRRQFILIADLNLGLRVRKCKLYRRPHSQTPSIFALQICTGSVDALSIPKSKGALRLL